MGVDKGLLARLAGGPVVDVPGHLMEERVLVGARMLLEEP
jgi:hypothetical protein